MIFWAQNISITASHILLLTIAVIKILVGKDKSSLTWWVFPWIQYNFLISSKECHSVSRSCSDFILRRLETKWERTEWRTSGMDSLPRLKGSKQWLSVKNKNVKKIVSSQVVKPRNWTLSWLYPLMGIPLDIKFRIQNMRWVTNVYLMELIFNLEIEPQEGQNIQECTK